MMAAEFSVVPTSYRTCVPAAVAGAELASRTRVAIVNGSGALAKLAKKRYLLATTFIR
jgi:hypothetical protein